MSELAATITALGAFVAAIGVIVTAVLSWDNRRETRNVARAAEAAKVAAEVAKVAAEEMKAEIIGASIDGQIIIGKQLDGRLTQLLKSERALAHAEGKAEGVRDERAEKQP